MEQDLQKKLNDQAILSSIEEAIKKAELKKVSEALKKYGRTTSGLIGIFQSRESQTLQSELKKIEKSTDSTDQKHAKMLTAINTAFATDKYITKKSALKDALNKAINIHELKKEFPCFEEDAARVPSL